MKTNKIIGLKIPLPL